MKQRTQQTINLFIFKLWGYSGNLVVCTRKGPRFVASSEYRVLDLSWVGYCWVMRLNEIRAWIFSLCHMWGHSLIITSQLKRAFFPRQNHHASSIPPIPILSSSGKRLLSSRKSHADSSTRFPLPNGEDTSNYVYTPPHINYYLGVPGTSMYLITFSVFFSCFDPLDVIRR